MKKWAKYFVVAMLLIAAAFAMADTTEPSATFTLTSSLSDPMPGETFTVTYKAKFANFGDSKAVYGLANIVTYDTSKFEFVSAAKGTDLPSTQTPETSTEGSVGFGLMSVGGDAIDEDTEYTIGTVTLKVKDAAEIGDTSFAQTETSFQTVGFVEHTPTANPLTVKVTAVPTGSVTYTLTPESGSFADAPMYKVDGDAGHASGSKYEVEFPDRTVTKKTVQVTFTDAEGYFTPKSVDVTIQKDQDLTPTMTYLTKGKITVNITPAEAVTAGAKWKLDGEANWRESGDTVSGLEEGSYTIKYKETTDYITPADSSVTIANKTGENIRTVNMSYKEKGSLTVNLTPNTAKWKIDNDATERASGSSVKVDAGTHTITFCAVDGYTTPKAETVEVPEEGTTKSYAYKEQGSLKYTLTPTTAQWSIDNGATWLNSGETKDKLDAGSYTVKFKDALGYFTPANENATVAVGEAKTATKEYTELGNVTVTIKKIGDTTPKWYLNGAVHASGDKVEGLEAGKYTVSFEEIKGYHKPADKTFEVKATNAPGANTFSYLNQDYGDSYGNVKVTFTPEGVAGGWSVDGTTWYESGKAIELKTGSYTVQFKSVEGYVTPLPQDVTVETGETAKISAKYTEVAKIDDKDLKPQSAAPEVTQSASQPASVSEVKADKLSAEETKKAENNLAARGVDAITGAPERMKKLNMLSSCKLSVTHTSTGNENLEFILTLADGLTLSDGQQAVVLLPANNEHGGEYAYTSFNATYDAASKKLTFTVTNFANFFSDANALIGAADIEKEPEPTPTPSSSSGGCNAGYGALALMFAIPLIFKKRK